MRTKNPKIIVYNDDGKVKFFKTNDKKDIAEYLGKPLSHINLNTWILDKSIISYHGDELIDLMTK